MACNVIQEYINFNRKNFKSYTKMIMDKYYNDNLFEDYMDMYINVRYYNQEPWIRKDFNYHICYYLDKVYEKNKSDISKLMIVLFKLYLYIDNVVYFDYDKDLDKFLNLIKDIREKKLNIKSDKFIKKFEDLIIYNEERKKIYISNFDSNDFWLEIKRIRNYNLYDVTLNHNVSVPKIFSKYAIDKVWNSKIISENKLQVEYYLISQIILKDIINGDFNKFYFTNFSFSLLEKSEKLKRTLNIFDNDIAKDLIIIKIKYTLFIKNKETVLNYIKQGYQFAIILDNMFLESNANRLILDVFKYIIIDNDKYFIGDIKERKNVIDLR